MHGPFHDDYDPTAAADRALYREAARLTAGHSAFHQLDPSEIAMRLEEYDPDEWEEQERDALRSQVFSGFLEYLFAEGPDPHFVRLRIEGFFHAFHPDLAEVITGPHEWCARESVTGVLRKYEKKLSAIREAARSRGALSTWSRELESEKDFESVRKVLVGLVELLASEGRTWRLVTASGYCIAKALRPALIAGMSLEDIATLSGDEGGRATPCDRGQRLVARRIAGNGSKGNKLHYQKSASAVEKYREAQLGNHNRRSPLKKKKTRKPNDPRK